MATDLRDGLRLCRLAEVLTGRPHLLDSTRYPSDRRPVRVANLQLALDAFVAAGLPLRGTAVAHRQQGGAGGGSGGSGGGASVMAAAAAAASGMLAAGELVDGDREMTLCLLWRLILHFQLPQVRSTARTARIARLRGLLSVAPTAVPGLPCCGA